MKVDRWENILSLTDNDYDSLLVLRDYRKFDIKEYLSIKINLIATYFSSQNRNSVILGISGGIDSAVAYYILKAVSEVIDLNIHLINIPIRSGTTDQEQGTLLSKLLSKEVSIIDLTSVQNMFAVSVSSQLNLSRSIWSDGQLSSCLRSPVYYYIASLLSDIGERPVVCGTINRSEGAYLGYWGKTSDASVDIQILSDLFKSEVYQLASYFNIPDEIINASPKGDVYDGSKDEELFGVSYDAVELFIANSCDPYVLEGNKCILSEDFKNIVFRINKMHEYNLHKYCAPSYGIWGKHLNVLESGCPGGWPITKVKDSYPTMIHGEFT